MAESPTPGFVPDDEVRESIRVIEQQRSRKLVGMLLLLAAVAVVLGTAVLLSYNEEPDAAKQQKSGTTP